MDYKFALEQEFGPDRAEEFIAYHKSNPEIWKLYEEFALEAVTSSSLFGSMAVINRIRWEETITRRNSGFKVNNNFAPFYARIFIMKYPQYSDKIELREVRK